MPENSYPAPPSHKILCITQILNLLLFSCMLFLAKLSWRCFSSLCSHNSLLWNVVLRGPRRWHVSSSKERSASEKTKQASCSSPASSGLQLAGCSTRYEDFALLLRWDLLHLPFNSFSFPPKSRWVWMCILSLLFDYWLSNNETNETENSQLRCTKSKTLATTQSAGFFSSGSAEGEDRSD